MKTVKAGPKFRDLTIAAATHAAVSFFSPIVNIWMLIAKEPRNESSSGKRIEAELLKS
jgi:hypothetical protein